MELTNHITGRYITGDNFFTNIILIRSLLGRPMTYNGTLKRTKERLYKLVRSFSCRRKGRRWPLIMKCIGYCNAQLLYFIYCFACTLCKQSESQASIFFCKNYLRVLFLHPSKCILWLLYSKYQHQGLSGLEEPHATMIVQEMKTRKLAQSAQTVAI